jgi:cell division protein FtsQ
MKMISDISYNTADRHNIHEADFGKKTKTSGKIEKGLKRLLILAMIIFAAQLIWLFGISPFFPFSTIEVHEISGFDRSQILKFSGIDDTSSFISTNAKDVEAKLTGHLLVESATVIKRFPDKLSIFIKPRQAAAVALTSIDSKQVPVYVDRQGVFFKLGDAASLDSSLPVISGFDNPRLNMRLPASLIPLVESLSDISSSSPQLLASVSEIRIERKAWEGFDLVLFPVHSSIKVRFENNLTEDALRYMLLMLNVFENSSQKPGEIDFRSGIGAYRLNERLL